MTAKRTGFFISSITVTGPNLPPAFMDFVDGLNIVSGASDTGKSYLCNLIDFVFGAKDKPRSIQAAKGYTRVSAKLRSRDGRAFAIDRALAGGNVTISELDPNTNAVRSERLASWKHVADDDSTLSAFLLRLSGIDAVKVRKNAKGETRNISFRDIAFLTVIDETRIISESPPHLSETRPLRTAEGEVLRLLVTGRHASLPALAAKATPRNAKAQLEIIDALISETESAFGSMDVLPDAVSAELATLENARAASLQLYEESRLEMSRAEDERAAITRKLRTAESRLAVLETMTLRFDLLEKHYTSDIERLTATREASSFLSLMPPEACPVCGAPPEAHRAEEMASHFTLDKVQQAADAEINKVDALRRDLLRVLAELSAESIEIAALRASYRGELQAREQAIENDLRPRARASAEQLEESRGRRDKLVQATMLVERLTSLRLVAAPLRARVNAGKVAASPAMLPTTGEMDQLASEIETVLATWKFPDVGRVVFSDEQQDLVIGGQERASHGKGVRALTCSAFIVGLLSHCSKRVLPHPGFLVLDSPLVAYKDPDQQGSESAKIRAAGVKDAFYRALAVFGATGQVIVLENEDPPYGITEPVIHYHFTKNSTGRYGFFPR